MGVAMNKQHDLQQAEKEELLTRPSPKAFVDYFCICQCQSNDFSRPRVVASIRMSMRTLVAFDVDSYLKRTFCLLELFQSIIQGCEIQFKICGREESKISCLEEVS